MYAANSENQWETVVLKKKHVDTKSKESLADAARNGKPIDTVKKENYQETSAKNRNLEKDIYSDPTQEAPEQKPIPKLSHEDKQLLIKTRTEKKLSQIDLANRINEQVAVIKNLEAGKPIENKNILQKINKFLGIKLKLV